MNLDAIARRIRKAMERNGSVVVVSGKTYHCYPTGMRDTALRNKDQTFRENYQTSIAVIDDDVTIALGDVVTFAGTESRVLATEKSADGVQNILHLGDKYGAR